jgi:hypothetical protein
MGRREGERLAAERGDHRPAGVGHGAALRARQVDPGDVRCEIVEGAGEERRGGEPDLVEREALELGQAAVHEHRTGPLVDGVHRGELAELVRRRERGRQHVLQYGQLRPQRPGQDRTRLLDDRARDDVRGVEEEALRVLELDAGVEVVAHPGPEARLGSVLDDEPGVGVVGQAPADVEMGPRHRGEGDLAPDAGADLHLSQQREEGVVGDARQHVAGREGDVLHVERDGEPARHRGFGERRGLGAEPHAVEQVDRRLRLELYARGRKRLALGAARDDPQQAEVRGRLRDGLRGQLRGQAVTELEPRGKAHPGTRSDVRADDPGIESRGRIEREDFSGECELGHVATLCPSAHTPLTTGRRRG